MLHVHIPCRNYSKRCQSMWCCKLMYRLMHTINILSQKIEIFLFLVICIILEDKEYWTAVRRLNFVKKHSLLLHSKLARLTRTKLSSCALERDRLLQKTLLGCDREVVGSNPARALFLKIHKRQIFWKIKILNFCTFASKCKLFLWDQLNWSFVVIALHIPTWMLFKNK